MNFSFTLESLIDLIGLIIGLSFGFGVIAYHFRKKTYIYLGLFIIVYALGFSTSIIDSLLDEGKTKQLLLSLSFSWFLYPLFYIYVQNISSLKVKEVKVPILIGLSGMFLEFFFKQYTPQNHENFSIYMISIVILEILISLFFGIKTVLWVKTQKKEVHNHFSNVNDKELNWSITYFIIGLSFTLIAFSLFIFRVNNVYFNYFLAITNVLLLIWISFKSVFQYQIKKIDDLSTDDPLITKETLPHSKENIDIEEKKKEIVKTLTNYLNTSKAYTKFDLTISDLSKATNIHTKLISGSINTILNLNFNSYINHFRIEEAKNKLKNSTYSNLSIEGIGQEVGFHSKSTFYRAFKKETGVTPKEFVSN